MRRTSLVFAAVVLAACNPPRPVVDGGGPGMDAFRPDGTTGCVRGPEDNAAACSDGCDNEEPEDTFVDCEDRGCCTVRTDCPPTSFCGMMEPFDAGPRPMECPTMGPEDTAAACGNGCDDDGNGFADCGDFDCCGVVTCPTGTACGDRPMRDGGTGGGRCDAGMEMENTLAACMDGCSNDMDTFADCEDRDCCGVRTDCAAGTYCGDRGMRDAGPPGMRCDAATTMENTAAACMDGCSNDMDTFVDCEDRDCCSVRTDCPATSYCGRPRPDAGPCTAGMENTVAECMDGCSNDGDRFVDCDDFSCCSLVTCGPTTSCGRRDAGTSP